MAIIQRARHQEVEKVEVEVRKTNPVPSAPPRSRSSSPIRVGSSTSLNEDIKTAVTRAPSPVAKAVDIFHPAYLRERFKLAQGQAYSSAMADELEAWFKDPKEGAVNRATDESLPLLQAKMKESVRAAVEAADQFLASLAEAEVEKPQPRPQTPRDLPREQAIEEAEEEVSPLPKAEETPKS